MITTILYVTLILQTNAEWVEISQQHYLKPTKRPDKTTRRIEETTKNDNLPWSNTESLDVEEITKGNNASLNSHWRKGNVIRVPASVARVEHVKKPGGNASRQKITELVASSEEIHDLVEKQNNQDSSVEALDENKSTKNKVTNKKDRMKDNSNSLSGNAHASGNNDKIQHAPPMIKHDNSKRRKEVEHLDEESLEIFEITLPKYDVSTKSPVHLNAFVNKGSSKRIYLYSTEHADKITATEVPQSTISKKGSNGQKGNKMYEISTRESSYVSQVNSKLSENIATTTTKAPVSVTPLVNNENKRRIYIQNIRKPSEEYRFYEDDLASEKSTVNYSVKKGYDVTKNSGKHDTIDSSYEQYVIKTHKGKGPNRIYINDRSRPSENSKFVTHKLLTDPLRKKKPTSEVFAQNEYKNTEQSDQYNKIQKPIEAEKSEKPFLSPSKGDVISKPNEKRAHVVRIDKPETRKPSINNLDFEGIADDTLSTTHEAQDIPIRRIDIPSLMTPQQPEFVTKQHYIENDDPKYLYKDVEETLTTQTSSKNSNEIFTQPPGDIPNDDDKAKWPNIDDSNRRIIPSNPTTEEPQSIDRSDEEFKSKSQETITKAKQPNPLENVIKFMKLVSNTITKNAHRNIKSKMRYLEDLRDTLLLNIEDHVEATWPDDERPLQRPRQPARQRRDAQAQARGQVDFPSSEGALMSISFLTFAVFLIKLVLQVINTYKNKTMMMGPAVFAVSRIAATNAGRSLN